MDAGKDDDESLTDRGSPRKQRPKLSFVHMLSGTEQAL